MLHLVPYHWNSDIRARTEAAEAMQGDIITDLILKLLELILKTTAWGVTGSCSHFRKISLITVESGLEGTDPKQEKPVRRPMGKYFSR